MGESSLLMWRGISFQTMEYREDRFFNAKAASTFK
jgi:hypothetical protein